MSDYDVHARTYDQEYGTVAEDIPFYVDLARRAGGPALEFAVGTGRVALPVARAGVPVTGIDRSPAMLARLRSRLAAEPALPVAAFAGDMRDADQTARGPFGLVYVPGRAFLHLLTVPDQLAALANARRHLRPGGLFAGSVFFPRASLLAQETRPWTPSHEYVDPDSGLRTIVCETARYDLRAARIHVLFRVEQVQKDGAVAASEVRDLTLTWVWPRELEHLLHRAGFDLERLDGDFAGTPFERGGSELVWVARRRD